MKKSILLILTVFFSCSKKEESPAPSVVVPTPILSCRVNMEDAEKDIKNNARYDYGKDGVIDGITDTYTKEGFNRGYTTGFLYENSLLIQLSQPNSGLLEKYEYKNGVLSKIIIVSTEQKNYIGYTIDIETDANKKIIKMTDSKGYQSDIKRDGKGNLLELKTIRITDKKEIFRLVNSDFDNKKSISELFKGWQFDVRQYYGDYMAMPFFSVGGSGNPIKTQTYNEGLLGTDLEYTFNYTADGYPTRMEILNKVTNKKTVYNYTLLNCK